MLKIEIFHNDCDGKKLFKTFVLKTKNCCQSNCILVKTVKKSPLLYQNTRF